MKKKFISERMVWGSVSHLVMLLFSITALLPFVLLIVASFTDNTTAMTYGFSFFPKKFSIEAYEYVGKQWTTIGRAYFMTIMVTVIGTAISLIITSLFAYTLTNKELPGGKILMFMCIFTMLFNGGIVSTYYVYASVFGIKNTIWALIIPYLLMNPFTVILVKNYFSNSISPSILEAARIDGASEFRIFGKVVLPLSLPIMATVGMMAAIAYWNDWTNGLYFLNQKDGGKLYTIQLVLNSINENINFLANSTTGLTSAATAANLPSTTMRMAIAVLGILPIMMAYPFFQKYFVKGITMGGVKE